MILFTVGSVPYANAIPLVAAFRKWSRDSDALGEIQVIYEVPSKLPSLLEAGEVEAILVSSVDALRVPDRRMAAGVCIGSDGPVKSVRLFSKVPFANIRSLALDQSSMTSNRLAQILLAERYGAHPVCSPEQPDQESMLAKYDACVLIGDIGMLASSEGLYVMDLGGEWQELTGLPFVWAAWIGNEGLTPPLAGLLSNAAEFYMVGPKYWQTNNPIRIEELHRRDEELISLGVARSGWREEMLRDYFYNVMVYRMDERALEGFREFQRLLLKHGFDDCVHFPEIVQYRGARSSAT